MADKLTVERFFKRHLWSIVVGIVGGLLAYAVSSTNIEGRVAASEAKIKSLKETVQLISENQKDIIRLQEQQQFNEEKIEQILTNQRDIKSYLNIQ